MQGYRDDDGVYLESDADEQLLIHIPFNQGGCLYSLSQPGPCTLHPAHNIHQLTQDSAAAVKLQGLVVKSSATEGRAPKHIKLFTNRASLGFSEAADFPAIQEFDLSEQDAKEGKLLTLK